MADLEHRHQRVAFIGQPAGLEQRNDLPRPLIGEQLAKGRFAAVPMAGQGNGGQNAVADAGNVAAGQRGRPLGAGRQAFHNGILLVVVERRLGPVEDQRPLAQLAGSRKAPGGRPNRPLNRLFARLLVLDQPPHQGLRGGLVFQRRSDVQQLAQPHPPRRLPLCVPLKPPQPVAVQEQSGMVDVHPVVRLAEDQGGRGHGGEQQGAGDHDHLF